MTATLDTALAAAARGWHVFPLRPSDKRPAVRRWEHRATTDPERLRRCWATGDYGVGIATGRSGLVVVDLDSPKPGRTPPDEWRGEPGVTNGQDVLTALCEHAGEPYPHDTYTVATASGGRHLYFTAPDGVGLRNTTGRLGWLIDTRGAGGYVVAARTTIDGHPYTVLNETDPAPLPAWLHDRLAVAEPAAAPAGPVELRTGHLSGYLLAAVRDETVRVRQAPEGQRNASLYMAAQTLGQLAATGALDSEHVRTALLYAVQPHLAAGAYTRRQADATIASGLRAGAKRPRQVAA